MLKYKLRTVDIWDTVLRRDCHPECIKLITARHMFLGDFDKLLPKFQHIRSLYQERLNAERKIAGNSKSEGFDDEYEITAVMKQWLSIVYRDSFESSLPRKLADFELTIEIARSYIDPEIIDFLSLYQSRQTVFLSDFYMGSDALQNLLNAKGLGSLFDGGISSCDIGLNKRSGRVFKYVHKQYGVSPEEHVHVGDNYWSDIESAKNYGINAIHYFPTKSRASRQLCESLFESRATLFDHLKSLSSREARMKSVDMTVEKASALQHGTASASFFIGFVLWIAEQALLRRLDKVYFIGDEGKFFESIFQSLFPSQAFYGHPLPLFETFSVSEEWSLCIRGQSISHQDILLFSSQFTHKSFAELFKAVQLKKDEIAVILEQYELQLSDSVGCIEKNEPLNKLFQSPVFIKSVEKTIFYRRIVLRNYLEKRGLEAKQNVALVNSSFNTSSLQKAMTSLFPETNFHVLSMYPTGNSDTSHSELAAAAYITDNNKDDSFTRLIDNVSSLAILSLSSYCDTRCYEKVCDEVVPLTKTLPLDNDFQIKIDLFQQGVILAAQCWNSYLDKYVVTSEDLQNADSHLLNEVLSKEGETMESALATPTRYESCNQCEVTKQLSHPSISTLFLAFIVKVKRQQIINYIRSRSQLDEGMKSYDIGYLHQLALSSVVKMANAFHKMRLWINKPRPWSNKEPFQ